MERAGVRKLGEMIWLRPIKGDDLEVGLVPAAASNVFDGVAVDPDTKTRRVCDRAFLDFRGYRENGVDVVNGHEARAELYRVPEVRMAIDNELLTRARVVAEGNGPSGSA